MIMSKRIAVFLDRDGTIIHDLGYLKNPEQVRLLPGVGQALSRLRELGMLLILVSNQSGVGRGLVTRREFTAVHRQVVWCLAQFGVWLDAAYYCFHAPEDGCFCRKPRTGMLLLAAENWNLDLARSFIIGDKAADIEAGHRAGCGTVLLKPKAASCPVMSPADALASSWPEVLQYIHDPS
jgi:D-glycero-D-manno-heptose 1,7-bisphosphate phosphatase